MFFDVIRWNVTRPIAFLRLDKNPVIFSTENVKYFILLYRNFTRRGGVVVVQSFNDRRMFGLIAGDEG